MPAGPKNKIEVFGIPRYAAQSVAEYLVMYMFALAKKLPLQIKNKNKQVFIDEYKGIELVGKKVGIIGFGNIGARVANICSSIGMDVCYWNRKKKDNKFIYLDLKEIFPKEIIYSSILLPSLLLIFSAFLGIFLKKDNKPFTKSWIFNDFTYWNIFALLLSFIALFHFVTNNSIHGIFTQIFAYISLLLGYANELRNEIIGKKGKK